LAAFSSLFLFTFVVLVLHSPEPAYHGTRLSTWLALHACGNDREKTEAATALHKIGTNALPWLLKWKNLDYDNYRRQTNEPAWKSKLLTKVAFDRHLRSAWKIRITYFLSPPSDMRDASLHGLRIL